MGPREQQTLEKAASALVAREGNSKVARVDPRQGQSELRPAWVLSTERLRECWQRQRTE